MNVPRAILITFAATMALVFLTTLFPDSTAFLFLTNSPDDNIELAEEDLETLAIALGRYQTTTGAYPSTEQGLNALVERPSIPPVPANWTQKLEELPLDPWRNPYAYEFDPDEESGSQVDLYSLGSDGEESDDDIESNIEL